MSADPLIGSAARTAREEAGEPRVSPRVASFLVGAVAIALALVLVAVVALAGAVACVHLARLL